MVKSVLRFSGLFLLSTLLRSCRLGLSACKSSIRKDTTQSRLLARLAPRRGKVIDR